MLENHLRLEKAKTEVIAATEQHNVKVKRFPPNGLFSISAEVTTPTMDIYLAFDATLRKAGLLPAVIVPHRVEGEFWLLIEIEVPRDWQPPAR